MPATVFHIAMMLVLRLNLLEHFTQSSEGHYLDLSRLVINFPLIK